MDTFELQRFFQQLQDQMRDAITAEMYERILPIPMIAHYTSLNAFESVVRGKELWFSRITDMNDISEVSEGADIIGDALEDHGAEIIRSVRYNDLNAELHFEETATRLLQDTYVLSLCEHGSDARTDRLGMWRAYGHNGRGLCLVLRKDTLLHQKAAGRFPVAWAPMEYDTSDQLSDRVQQRLRLVEGALQRIPSAARKLLTPHLGVFISRCLVSLVLGHKNESFDDEREVRFVRSASMNPLPLPSGAEYRNIGTTQPPRHVFALPLRDYPEFPINASLPALLDHIIVGPSDRQNEMAQQVRDLLNIENLSQVQVVLSKIPYRATR